MTDVERFLDRNFGDLTSDIRKRDYENIVVSAHFEHCQGYLGIYEGG